MCFALHKDHAFHSWLLGEPEKTNAEAGPFCLCVTYILTIVKCQQGGVSIVRPPVRTAMGEMVKRTIKLD